MKKENEYFIRILRNHLWKRETEPPRELNWESLSQLSKAHQVGGIIYKQCRGFLPPEINKSLEWEYSAAIYSFVVRRANLVNLKKAFEERDIPFFCVKGSAVARYYPTPALRTMGDTDLVVHPCDREKADGVLRLLHYESRSRHDDREWIYYQNGLEYELHDRLVYAEAVNLQRHVEFFNDCWNYVKNDELDPSFQLLFLLLHLRKHLMNAGVGFRQFLDIAMMIQYEPELNWPWIKARLDELEMAEFSSVCFELISRWFEVSAPFPRGEMDERFFETATQAIFDNGIFGFHNSKNRNNAAVNTARKSSHPVLSMAKNILLFVFPSRETMSKSSKYSFVQKRPYLLPIAWLLRLINALKDLRKAGRLSSRFIASKEQIAGRDEYLKQWGL